MGLGAEKDLVKDRFECVEIYEVWVWGKRKSGEQLRVDDYVIFQHKPMFSGYLGGKSSQSKE